MKKAKILLLVAVWSPQSQEEEYGTTVPCSPGCFSAGEDLNEAVSNTREALLFHTEEQPLTQEQVLYALDLQYHLMNDHDLKDCWWHPLAADAYVEDDVMVNHERVELRDLFRNIDEEVKTALSEVPTTPHKS